MNKFTFSSMSEKKYNLEFLFIYIFIRKLKTIINEQSFNEV